LAPVYTLVMMKKYSTRASAGGKFILLFAEFSFVQNSSSSVSILMPMAIESFDLSSYDIVISDSNSYAKGAITGASTLHICYCHTPMRYAWDNYYSYAEVFLFRR